MQSFSAILFCDYVLFYLFVDQFPVWTCHGVDRISAQLTLSGPEVRLNVWLHLTEPSGPVPKERNQLTAFLASCIFIGLLLWTGYFVLLHVALHSFFLFVDSISSTSQIILI